MTRAPTTRRARLAVTPGCPAGIGPEVAARALVEARLPRGVEAVWFASAAQLVEGARRARVPAAVLARGVDGPTVVRLCRGARVRDVRCAVREGDDAGAHAKPGVVDAAAMRSQRDALVRACEAAARGEVHGIVTGPTRKAALVVDGVHYPGQTEIVHRFLASDAEPPLMVFAGGPFVLGLATVHVPLRDVAAQLTPHALDVALARLEEAARRIAGLRASQRPRLVVLGVNPHAGEGGLLGREEIDVVTPALERARARGVDVKGPVPADGFFADVARGALRASTRRARGAGAAHGAVHGVLAMHHDQGLAPYKLLATSPAGGEGVNVTWGVRAPRTSPDHGTADAIAGRGVASAASFTAALELCARLAKPPPRAR